MKNPKEIKIKKPMGRPKKIKELAPPDIQPEVSVSLFEELSSDSIAMETIITDTSAEAFAIKNTKKIANKSNIGLEVTDNVVKLDDIDWFTEVDYNSKGKIAANYPAWYYDIPLDELKEEIRTIEQGIDDGFYGARLVKTARKKLSEKKERYDKIVEGKPKFSGKKIDEIYKTVKEFEKDILDSRFTWEECWGVKKHHADAHEEARRMVKPCIKIPNEIVAGFVKQAKIRVENGKISRNDAINACAVLAKSIGEKIDVDYR